MKRIGLVSGIGPGIDAGRIIDRFSTKTRAAASKAHG